MPDRRLVVGAALGGLLLVAAVVGGPRLARRSPSQGPATGEGAIAAPAGQTPSATQASTNAPQGLGCIRGGTTREEVRTIMGEPDSVAFGDWVYGRSSVTFGYGVVLDYTNAGGNLRLCP